MEEILPGFDVIPTATIAWFLSELVSGLESQRGVAVMDGRITICRTPSRRICIKKTRYFLPALALIGLNKFGSSKRQRSQKERTEAGSTGDAYSPARFRSTGNNDHGGRSHGRMARHAEV